MTEIYVSVGSHDNYFCVMWTDRGAFCVAKPPSQYRITNYELQITNWEEETKI